MMVTPLYAALLVLWLLVLSMRVVRRRGSDKIVLGDGGNPSMLRVIRAQANFTEYVPLALLMMAMLVAFIPPRVIRPPASSITTVVKPAMRSLCRR